MGVMLSQKEGDVGGMVQEICGTLPAPRMDGGRICAYFLWHHRVEGTEVLERIGEGGPAEVRVGGNLESELEYGNHRSVAKNGGRR